MVSKRSPHRQPPSRHRRERKLMLSPRDSRPDNLRANPQGSQLVSKRHNLQVNPQASRPRNRQGSRLRQPLLRRSSRRWHARLMLSISS